MEVNLSVIQTCEILLFRIVARRSNRRHFMSVIISHIVKYITRTHATAMLKSVSIVGT